MSMWTHTGWGGVASSPGSSQFFNVTRRKTGEPGIELHVTYVRAGAHQSNLFKTRRLSLLEAPVKLLLGRVNIRQ